MKNKVRIMFVAVALLTTVCLYNAVAQDKAQWSGTWKMVPDKSKFNGGGPSSIVIKLEFKEGTISETMTMGGDNGERSFSATYTTDGKESTQEVMGRSAKTSARWEGSTLIIKFDDGNGSPFIRKFTLSEDGKTMTVVRPTNDQGGQDETIVFEKQ